MVLFWWIFKLMQSKSLKLRQVIKNIVDLQVISINIFSTYVERSSVVSDARVDSY